MSSVELYELTFLFYPILKIAFQYASWPLSIVWKGSQRGRSPRHCLCKIVKLCVSSTSLSVHRHLLLQNDHESYPFCASHIGTATLQSLSFYHANTIKTKLGRFINYTVSTRSTTLPALVKWSTSTKLTSSHQKTMNKQTVT